jgi:hypothetical protein
MGLRRLEEAGWPTGNKEIEAILHFASYFRLQTGHDTLSPGATSEPSQLETEWNWLDVLFKFR